MPPAKTGSAAALVVVFSNCSKEGEDACGLTPARIIRYDCDRVIFQLLTHESIGDNDWVDITTGQHYSNVVSYYNNTCRIVSSVWPFLLPRRKQRLTYLIFQQNLVINL